MFAKRTYLQNYANFLTKCKCFLYVLQEFFTYNVKEKIRKCKRIYNIMCNFAAN